jgi:hypothetical protein
MAHELRIDKLSGHLKGTPGSKTMDPSGSASPEHQQIMEALKPGRKRVEISPETVEVLGKLNCSRQDIAYGFGVSIRTIENRFKDPEVEAAYERGKAKGRIALRILQQKIANSQHGSAGNVVIHLSKHILGETDKAALELTGANGGPVLMTFRTILEEIDGKSRLMPVAQMIDVSPEKPAQIALGPPPEKTEA